MGFALSGIKMEKIADAVSNSFPHTHIHAHVDTDRHTYIHTGTHTLVGGRTSEWCRLSRRFHHSAVKSLKLLRGRGQVHKSTATKCVDNASIVVAVS